MPHWRRSTWVLVIVNTILLVWLIGGLQAAGEVPVGNDYEEAGRAIGTGLGVMFILGLAFMFNLIGVIAWYATKPKEPKAKGW